MLEFLQEQENIKDLEPIYFYELSNKILNDTINYEKEFNQHHGDRIKMERLLFNVMNKAPGDKMQMSTMFLETLHNFATTFTEIPYVFKKALVQNITNERDISYDRMANAVAAHNTYFGPLGADNLDKFR